MRGKTKWMIMVTSVAQTLKGGSFDAAKKNSFLRLFVDLYVDLYRYRR